MFVRKSTYENTVSELNNQIALACKRSDEYEAALEAIIAQRTQAPNATVTRILNIAEEALGE